MASLKLTNRFTSLRAGRYSDSRKLLSIHEPHVPQLNTPHRLRLRPRDHLCTGYPRSYRDNSVGRFSYTPFARYSTKIHFEDINEATQQCQDNEYLSTALSYTLKGVLRASEASDSSAQAASRLLSSFEPTRSDNHNILLEDLLQAVTANLGHGDIEALHIIKLTVAITFMRNKCHRNVVQDSLRADELDIIWDIFRDALLSPLYAQKRAVRSHQGFLSVPLCDLRKLNGDSEELWRLHLWLPNRPQPDPKFIMHSHKSYAQSWILAGQGTNGEYEVSPVQDITMATNAIFALTDHRTITHRQLSSTIVNTGKLVNVKSIEFDRHTKNMSYTVPAAAFHTSSVAPEEVHATVFFFDASRGYSDDGGVSLGPKEVPTVEQYRDPGGFMASTLGYVVEVARKWESGLEKGLSCARAGQWPQARAVFDDIVTMWKSLLDANPGTDGPATSNNIQGLNHYLNIAQKLELWAQHVIRGYEYRDQDDIESARIEWALAKRVCQTIADATIANRCEEISFI